MGSTFYNFYASKHNQIKNLCAQSPLQSNILSQNNPSEDFDQIIMQTVTLDLSH